MLPSPAGVEPATSRVTGEVTLYLLPQHFMSNGALLFAAHDAIKKSVRKEWEEKVIRGGFGFQAKKLLSRYPNKIVLAQSEHRLTTVDHNTVAVVRASFQAANMHGGF